MLLVALSAISFGVMPLLVTKIYSYGCSTPTLLFFRQAIPVPLFLWLGRRDLARTVHDKGRVLAAASLFSSAITPLLLMGSYRHIPSGMSTTLHFVYPMFVFLIEVLFLRRGFSLAKLMCYVCCAAGVWLLQGGAAAGDMTGVVMALVSGVTYAIFIVMLECADTGSYDPRSVNAVILSVSGAGMLCYALLTKSATFALPPEAYALILVFAFLIAVCGSMFFQIGVACIGGQRAALFSCLEPITSVFCGVLVMKETLAVQAVIGTVIILCAITASVLVDARKAETSAKESD